MFLQKCICRVKC